MRDGDKMKCERCGCKIFKIKRDDIICVKCGLYVAYVWKNYHDRFKHYVGDTSLVTNTIKIAKR